MRPGAALGPLLRNVFAALPAGLLEAAYLDGASVFRAFFRIALPLAGPALAALVVFQFLRVWNDLLVSLVFPGGAPSVAPVTLRLTNRVGSLGQSWHLLTAAAFVAITVPVAVFLAVRRHFVRGVLSGSLKGLTAAAPIGMFTIGKHQHRQFPVLGCRISRK